jgi:hypothetical protein
MNVSPEATTDMRAALEGTFDEINGSTYLERDSRGLARMGKSQVLKVAFEPLTRRSSHFSAGFVIDTANSLMLANDQYVSIATIWVSFHFWI